MAMAQSGKNRHYHWYNVQPRHFISTANQVGFNEKTARTIVTDMMASVDNAIANVELQIPAGFPDTIAVPILSGIRKQRDRYVTAAGLE